MMVGALFIIATVLNVLGNTLSRPVFDAPDYLVKASAYGDQVVIGALSVLVSAFACAGIAIGLYPVLKRHHEALALGSVAMRTIEAVFYIIAVVCLLSLLTLSQEAVKAGAADASSLQASGTLLLAVRKWAGQLGVVAFALGALMYYWVFYQSELIPRWLSGWGILGAGLSLAAASLTVFGWLIPFSTSFVLMNLPIGVQEIVLAVWLITRGFSSSPVAALSVKAG